MNDYREIKFKLSPAHNDVATGDSTLLETAADILASLLADAGFESFVRNDDVLTAYIPVRLYNRDTIDEVLTSYPFSNSCRVALDTNVFVEGRDWNEEWEKNYFQPIVIDNKCVIHSSFHKDFPKCDFDITIDPRMAFGTGHHATTSLMIRALLSNEVAGKSVLDVGTGSGILAILAVMLGALDVTGIEIDPMAFENAIENAEVNQCGKIKFILGDAAEIEKLPRHDIILANINRNVILNDIGQYAANLNPTGKLILSGFYDDDIPMLLEAASKHGLTECGRAVKDKWARLELKFAQ